MRNEGWAKAAAAVWLGAMLVAPLGAQQPDDAAREQQQRVEVERQRAQAEQERAQQLAQADQQRSQAEQQRELQRIQAEQQRQQQRAQTEQQREQQREQRAQAEEQREQAQQQRAEALENARRELAEAAREVARLSAQVAGPAVGEVTRRFRYAGQRAMLGLNIEDTELGVRVAGVSPNGPAAAAGLVVGDTIVAIEGADLADGGNRSPSELLLAQMTNVEPGERVELRILRDGDYRDVEVQARSIEPGQFFDWSAAGNAFPFSGPRTWRGMFQPRPWRDLDLVPLTPALGQYFGTDKGLLVVRAPQDTTLGLRDGDVILAIGDREPQNPEHAARILASFEPNETLTLAIMRNQRRETLEVRIPTE